MLPAAPAWRARRAKGIIACVVHLRLRLLTAVILTAISLTLLIWSLWPYRRIIHRQLIQSTEMQAPTPNSFLTAHSLV